MSKAPLQETLNNLCFVTGSDHNFFDLMVECIESIKKTHVYKSVPICILDCGLKEEQKKILNEKYHVYTIMPYQYFFDFPEEFQKLPGYKCMFSRPYMPKIFPGFRYYFWIDCDTWIQNEESIDAYINLCTKQGIGISTHKNRPLKDEFKIKIYQACDEELLTEDKINVSSINAGISCIDAESPIFESWQNNLKKNVAAKGCFFTSEQFSLNLSLSTDMKFLDARIHNYILHQFKMPLVDENNKLYDPISKKMIGIMHLTLKLKKFFNMHEFPCIDINYSNYEKQKPEFNALFEAISKHESYPYPEGIKKASLRYIAR